MTNTNSSFENFIPHENFQRTINECVNNLIYKQYEGYEHLLPENINQLVSISELRDSGRELLSECGNNTLTSEQKENLCNQFQKYCRIVKKRKIVLRKNFYKLDYSNPNFSHFEHNQNAPEFNIMPFKTRFTSYSYLRDSMLKYENFWEYMELAGYKDGVFLTLTVDTNRVLNRIESNKKCSEGLNKLLTSFRTMHKKKFDYLCVPEFTKKGFLHFHLVFFGTPHIDNIHHIQKLWNQKYNIAIQTDIQRMVFRDGRWKSLRKKSKSPKTWQNKQIPDLQEYLEKYLKKNFFNTQNSMTDDTDLDFSSALFWTLNRRWFSTSRIKITNRPEEGLCLLNAVRTIQEKDPPKYSFWSSYNNYDTIPIYILDNSDNT